MKIAISLPDSLFHAADSLAKRMGMSRSELFRAAVADYIVAHKHDQVREDLDAVYSEQPSQLDEELMRMQTMSVKGGAMKDHRGGEKLCLSHKFAANCRGDDRYGIELTISAIDVIPSGF